MCDAFQFFFAIFSLSAFQCGIRYFYFQLPNKLEFRIWSFFFFHIPIYYLSSVIDSVSGNVGDTKNNIYTVKLQTEIKFLSHDNLSGYRKMAHINLINRKKLFEATKYKSLILKTIKNLSIYAFYGIYARSVVLYTVHAWMLNRSDSFAWYQFRYLYSYTWVVHINNHSVSLFNISYIFESYFAVLSEAYAHARHRWHKRR